ncbi:hypothetical protein LTR28_000249, partial [Elasticomyces elasticus]
MALPVAIVELAPKSGIVRVGTALAEGTTAVGSTSTLTCFSSPCGEPPPERGTCGYARAAS